MPDLTTVFFVNVLKGLCILRGDLSYTTVSDIGTPIHMSCVGPGPTYGQTYVNQVEFITNHWHRLDQFGVTTIHAAKPFLVEKSLTTGH